MYEYLLSLNQSQLSYLNAILQFTQTWKLTLYITHNGQKVKNRKSRGQIKAQLRVQPELESRDIY